MINEQTLAEIVTKIDGEVKQGAKALPRTLPSEKESGVGERSLICALAH